MGSIDRSSGVVWNLYGPIEGTGQAIGAIKAAGKRVVYVSNNSVRPLENYQEQIQKLGHEVTEEDLVHPAVSIVRYLKSIDFNGLIYAIGSNAFLKTLRDAGYDVLNGVSYDKNSNVCNLLNCCTTLARRPSTGVTAGCDSRNSR